ncbi:MAG TPA: DUF1206 domain-containing protein [Ilumatobacteraceae bacterium]|nr:DUF1206 domain-containing protein [Ilumatobacteraceae bacterium]
MDTTAPTTSPSGDQSTDSDVGVERAEEFAREHPAIVKFGRIGWVAKGIVYALVGVLSLIVGVSASRSDSSGDAASGGQEASQTGAITRIAESSFGVVLLFVVAAGLVIYALWRLVTVMLPADNDVKAWLTRAGYLVSAVAYLLLAWSAVTLAVRPRGSGESEDARVERFTRDLMNDGLGRAAVFAIGAVLLVLAAVFLWQAVSARFESQLLPGSVGPVSHQTLVLLGRIGWVGRSGMMALIGFFLVRAAVTFDASDAEGLDGSLRKAASSTIGLVLVVVVGAGLLVFGAFCILSAPKQRMVGADS